MIGPFLVHKLLGPRPPPLLSSNVSLPPRLYVHVPKISARLVTFGSAHKSEAHRGGGADMSGPPSPSPKPKPRHLQDPPNPHQR